MNANFRIGDVVHLKSLGFTMTVKAIHDGLVTCQWQETEGDRNSVRTETFPAEMLTFPVEETDFFAGYMGGRS